jgi:farnesyl diphosphate synthase/geranylgeranyl diphosphate synthase type II
MLSFDDFCQQYRDRVNNTLTELFSQTPGPAPELSKAMQYSSFNGGKRIRPLLVYAGAMALGEPSRLTDISAAAVECIHAYSLIHDDLPAMDDDDLRRGKPTCHIVFGEATAILAGDALQTLAFEWLSQNNEANANTQLAILQTLAKASGNNGMVAGQAIDLSAVDQELNLEQLTTMHNLKTGALIDASIQMGALSTDMASSQQLVALKTYAQAIGLAFQVQDDILDVTSDTETLGKQQGADMAHNKPTFVSLLGLDGAREKASKLYNDALNALSSFDYRADYLRHLAAYIIKRQH